MLLLDILLFLPDSVNWPLVSAVDIRRGCTNWHQRKLMWKYMETFYWGHTFQILYQEKNKKQNKIKNMNAVLRVAPQIQGKGLPRNSRNIVCWTWHNPGLFPKSTFIAWGAYLGENYPFLNEGHWQQSMAPGNLGALPSGESENTAAAILLSVLPSASILKRQWEQKASVIAVVLAWTLSYSVLWLLTLTIGRQRMNRLQNQPH